MYSQKERNFTEESSKNTSETYRDISEGALSLSRRKIRNSSQTLGLGDINSKSKKKNGSSKFKPAGKKRVLALKGEPSQDFKKLMKDLAHGMFDFSIFLINLASFDIRIETEDIDAKKMGKNKSLTAQEKLMEESARNIRTKGKVKDSRDLGDFDPLLLLDVIEEKRKEKPKINSNHVKSALVHSILQEAQLKKDGLQLPLFERLKDKLKKENAKKNQKRYNSKARVDTNLAGKKIKNLNQLEFEKNKGKLFKPKYKKMSTKKMLKIGEKVDTQISSIVDYSIKEMAKGARKGLARKDTRFSVKDGVLKQSDLKYSLMNTLSKKKLGSKGRSSKTKLLLLSLEEEEDQLAPNSALMRTLSATFKTSNISAKNKNNLKLNNHIINKCMNLQGNSTNLKQKLDHKEEIVHKIYDDFQKLVEFNREVWYDKDMDELYDDMVLGHLREEQYMPRVKPLISLRDSGIFERREGLKRGRSGSKAGKKEGNGLKNRMENRKSVAVVQMPKLAQSRNFKDLKEMDGKKEGCDENFNIFQSSQLSPASGRVNDVVEKQEEDELNKKSRASSVVEESKKKVGKASFGVKKSIHNSQENILPSLAKEAHETSGQSLRKMPKIVRKMLEKKMNIDSDFIKNIELYEKGRSDASIPKIGNISKVRSYFENQYRQKELVVNFKSMDNFANEAVMEYRNAQKHKALEMMKKLGTNFLA
ncbi:unnamed protein product [Moneuplotes crassus]|uniref:Uncharacterized protein n=1 Tax=Euplotes crassus TaxID=5936 RepID=A0AAD1Y975_EUPCR|nr:unnamed protein product [Moneuplotes crassus]